MLERRKLTNWSLSWLITEEHQNSKKGKRNMIFKWFKGSPVHTHTLEIKSIEVLKIRLKECLGNIHSYNTESVIFRLAFRRCHKLSRSWRVFDLAARWFQLSEVWSMHNTPPSAAPLSHSIYSAKAGLSRQHPASDAVRHNLAVLGTASFPETFGNIFALQTGIKDFRFTNDTRGAENISRKYWFIKASGVSVALL